MVESYDIPSVNQAEVLRYLGHHGQEISQDLLARLAEKTDACLAAARPRGCVRTFDVARIAEGEVVLEGCVLRLRGNDICAHLAGARAVGVMAVTLGAAIDRELQLLSHTDALGQVLFDAAATALVERAADAAEASLVSQAAGRDLYVNWRFSPGYGDLPLDCQPQILATLDAQRRLGLGLTDSMLLVPTKSVTAVIGMFETPQDSRVELCDKCHCRDFCTIRATGRTCHGKE